MSAFIPLGFLAFFCFTKHPIKSKTARVRGGGWGKHNDKGACAMTNYTKEQRTLKDPILNLTDEIYDKFPVPDMPGETRKKRYKILTADNFFEQQTPIIWTVDGLISEGSVSVFYGEAGCGKTWALMDLAVCVARGAPWLNMATIAGPVLIVDEESGSRRLSRRMGEILHGHDASADIPVMATSLAAFNLGHANDIGEFYNLIIETHARLVIIDALADVMPGRDENAVKDTAPIFLSLRKIAEETQAAIIVIHHANKTGGYRGSSAIKGAIDLLLAVEKKNDSQLITFKTEKARDTTAGAFAAEMNFLPGKFWLSSTEYENAPKSFNKGQRFVLRYLLEHGESAVPDVSSNADSCSEITARNAVYELVDTLYVKRTNDGGRGKKAVVDLTDKGRTAAGSM